MGVDLRTNTEKVNVGNRLDYMLINVSTVLDATVKLIVLITRRNLHFDIN